jgi:hypothetical protein
MDRTMVNDEASIKSADQTTHLKEIQLLKSELQDFATSLPDKLRFNQFYEMHISALMKRINVMETDEK